MPNRAASRGATTIMITKHCVAEAVAEGGETADTKVREASDAITRLVRS